MQSSGEAEHVRRLLQEEVGRRELASRQLTEKVREAEARIQTLQRNFQLKKAELSSAQLTIDKYRADFRVQEDKVKAVPLKVERKAATYATEILELKRSRDALLQKQKEEREMRTGLERQLADYGNWEAKLVSRAPQKDICYKK